MVASNHAVPWHLLGRVDEALDEYRVCMLNAPTGIPDRDGVTPETSFVGPRMRGHPRLSHVPSRLSMVPGLFETRRLRPDAVLLHTTPPRKGKLSLGVEVNVLPAAVEAARRHGGVVIAQANREMPWTYGDAVLDVDLHRVALVAPEGGLRDELWEEAEGLGLLPAP